MLKNGHSLSLLGVKDAPIRDVIAQATAFMSACYGQRSSQSMSQACWKVWASKAGHASASLPKLCDLSPTNEAFEENVEEPNTKPSCGVLWKTTIRQIWTLSYMDGGRIQIQNPSNQLFFQ